MSEKINCGYGKGGIQEKNGRFYYRWYENGREHSKALKNVTSREEAEIEAARYRAAASAETIEEIALVTARAKSIIKECKSIPISQIGDKFIESPLRLQTGKTSIARNLRNISAFVTFMARYRPEVRTMAEVTKDDTAAWASSLSNMSSSNYNVYIGSLKLAFRVLFERSGLAVNPFIHLPRRTILAKSKKEFSAAQLKKVFAAVDRDYPLEVLHRGEMRVIFRLAAYTGMRFKDCCLLRRQNIINNSIIKVKPYKTEKSGKFVEIPIHPELLELLATIDGDRRPEAYVFPAVAERYLRNPSGVNKTACRVIWWAMAEEKPGHGKLPEAIPGYGFHSFRHTFVSFCYNAGVPINLVREIVGHSSEAVTRIYTHLSADAMKQVTDALSGQTSDGARSSAAAKLEQIALLIRMTPKNNRLANEIRAIIEE